MIAMAVCGFAFWFFFVPVHISVSCPHMEGEPSRCMGDLSLLKPGKKCPAASGIKVTIINHDDCGNATIAISRWQYLLFHAKDYWTFDSDDVDARQVNY